MGWILLNASLSVSADSMACEGGSVTATVTVTGKTDDRKEVNEYTASIRDDYVIPDILWDSGPKSVGANAEVEESFTVEIRCNEKCHVVGPDGDSGERTAELYAYVLSEELEGASDEVPVTCVR
ncbi:MAG: hypothetical protein KJN94_09585 [Gammaproteobacteria bacterium]|nr:hypothetical protein [Gammaproteobacteria bacterium]